MRPDQRQVGGPEPVARGLRLVPIGIGERRLADRVEPGALVGGEAQVRGLQVAGELRVGARMITEATPGRPSSQASATSAAEAPSCASPTATSASTMS